MYVCIPDKHICIHNCTLIFTFSLYAYLPTGIEIYTLLSHRIHKMRKNREKSGSSDSNFTVLLINNLQSKWQAHNILMTFHETL